MSRLCTIDMVSARGLVKCSLVANLCSGTVVRVSPNELTFCSPKAWKDIYGLQPGHPRLTKDPVLYCPDPFAKAYSLISAEGELYQNLRRPFSSAFSQESLLKQEIVIQYHVDLLVKRLRTKIGQQVDMAEWFTWTTFDILGALAFGKSFGSLECGRCMTLWG